MRYKERFKTILDILQKETRVLVTDLSQRFGLSEVTIRKDLDKLESMGLLRRFHSGAVSVEHSVFDIPVKQKLTKNQDLKLEIAETARGMVESGMSIIIDAGSTAHKIARAVRNIPGLRIVTNSLMVGAELVEASGIDLLLTGGNLKSESQAMVGPIALETLRKVHVDIAFIGAMGVSFNRGFMSASFLETETKETMLLSARRSVIVADHTKIGKESFVPFAKFNEIDLMITDSEIDKAVFQQLQNAGISIAIANRIQ